MNSNVRKSNFELMRIVSMFMIVFWHIIIHGHVLENCQRESIKILFNIIEFICVVHVNSFVLCTGYFQSNSSFKMSSVIKNIILCIFYSIVIILVFSLIYGNYNYMNILKVLYTLGFGEYWFMTDYIILYCLSPFINKYIKSLNKKEFKKLLLVLFILFSMMQYISTISYLSNSLYNFIFLYFIGAYLREYPLKKSFLFEKKSISFYRLVLLIVFIICVIYNFSTVYVAKNINSFSNVFSLIFTPIVDQSLQYSNPIVIIQTICYFCFFETLNLNSKFINNISKLTIGIYLISDNHLMRFNIYKLLKIDNGSIISYKYIIYTLFVAIFIYVVCAIIEWIRQNIFKFIYNRKLSIKWRNFYRKWIDSLGIKISW